MVPLLHQPAAIQHQDSVAGGGGRKLMAHHQDRALPLLAVSGFANTSYNALANSFLQMAAPPNMRGRVVSIYLLNRGLAPLGTLMAGALATWFDTRIALALMGGSCALLVAYIAVAARTVREIE